MKQKSPKPKSCKPKSCKVCKEKFTPSIYQPFAVWCSPTCAFAWSNILKRKKSDKETKVMKDNLMTVTDWKTILQTPINLIIRLIDSKQACIATGNYNGKMNAGHYISRGANDTIRFHLDNIHIQSEHSNSYKGGDTINYQNGIRQIYGLEYFDYIETLNGHDPIKLSIPEIKELVIVARRIVKELKAEDRIYSAVERLELRKKYNSQLGIYSL